MSSWAFFRREVIPDIVDPRRPYITRWRILRTPWFSVYLHAIHLPDADRHLHDHPWSFVSIVLRGGYVEQRRGRGLTTRRAGSVAFRRAEDLHRVARLLREPTWTFVLVGRRRREWGFVTERGWVWWRDYFAKPSTAAATLRGRGVGEPTP